MMSGAGGVVMAASDTGKKNVITFSCSWQPCQRADLLRLEWTLSDIRSLRYDVSCFLKSGPAASRATK